MGVILQDFSKKNAGAIINRPAVAFNEFAGSSGERIKLLPGGQ